MFYMFLRIFIQFRANSMNSVHLQNSTNEQCNDPVVMHDLKVGEVTVYVADNKWLDEMIVVLNHKQARNDETDAGQQLYAHQPAYSHTCAVIRLHTLHHHVCDRSDEEHPWHDLHCQHSPWRTTHQRGHHDHTRADHHHHSAKQHDDALGSIQLFHFLPLQFLLPLCVNLCSGRRCLRHQPS